VEQPVEFFEPIDRNCEYKKPPGRTRKQRQARPSTAVMAEHPFIALWGKCEQSAARNQGATRPAGSCIDDEAPRAVHGRSRSH
jgi:hypothetical protein